jgi:hypothetical protein
MVMKSTPTQVHLFWGVEQFTITSQIDRLTGQLLQATMVNELTLRMRYNSSLNLESYQAELPVTIRRVLHLEICRTEPHSYKHSFRKLTALGLI